MGGLNFRPELFGAGFQSGFNMVRDSVDTYIKADKYREEQAYKDMFNAAFSEVPQAEAEAPVVSGMGMKDPVKYQYQNYSGPMSNVLTSVAKKNPSAFRRALADVDAMRKSLVSQNLGNAVMALQTTGPEAALPYVRSAYGAIANGEDINLFIRDGKLFSQRIDMRSGKPKGKPIELNAATLTDINMNYGDPAAYETVKQQRHKNAILDKNAEAAFKTAEAKRLAALAKGYTPEGFKDMHTAMKDIAPILKDQYADLDEIAFRKVMAAATDMAMKPANQGASLFSLFDGAYIAYKNKTSAPPATPSDNKPSAPKDAPGIGGFLAHIAGIDKKPDKKQALPTDVIESPVEYGKKKAEYFSKHIKAKRDKLVKYKAKIEGSGPSKGGRKAIASFYESKTKTIQGAVNRVKQRMSSGKAPIIGDLQVALHSKQFVNSLNEKQLDLLLSVLNKSNAKI